MTAIRVLLVDDHPLFRQGVAYTLSREPDIDVVGEAASGKQALALARSLVPDVILLDITMPDGDGLATAAQLGQELPTARVIMLTASEEGDDLVMAMKVGARRVRCQGGRGQPKWWLPCVPSLPAMPTSHPKWPAACCSR